MTLSSLRLSVIRSVIDEIDRQNFSDARSLLLSLYADIERGDAYLQKMTSPEAAQLKNIWQQTQAQNMVSGHLVGKFLQLLIQISGAVSILEIGTLTGYSALAMAAALPENGTVITCEKDIHVADIAQANFDSVAWGTKINLKIGNAIASLHQLAEEQSTFDLIFLDGDKKGYLEYFKLIMNGNLLRSGGILCADNTLFSGQVWQDSPSMIPQSINDFNQLVAQDDRVEQLILPLRDGITLIRRH